MFMGGRCLFTVELNIPYHQIKMTLLFNLLFHHGLGFIINISVTLIFIAAFVQACGYCEMVMNITVLVNIYVICIMLIVAEKKDSPGNNKFPSISCQSPASSVILSLPLISRKSNTWSITCRITLFSKQKFNWSSSSQYLPSEGSL